MRLGVAICGASGSIYGVRTLAAACRSTDVSGIQLVVSRNGLRVIQEELSLGPEDLLGAVAQMAEVDTGKITIYPNDDIGAPMASGSSAPDATVIVPCSMATLGAIASGHSQTLIARAADVMLKERRKLVLVPRETPFNLIHLENMRRLCLAGAVILPASPGFYHRPATIDALVDQVVGKIFDALRIPHELPVRWTGAAG